LALQGRTYESLNQRQNSERPSTSIRIRLCGRDLPLGRASGAANFNRSARSNPAQPHRRLHPQALLPRQPVRCQLDHLILGRACGQPAFDQRCQTFTSALRSRQSRRHRLLPCWARQTRMQRMHPAKFPANLDLELHPPKFRRTRSACSAVSMKTQSMPTHLHRGRSFSYQIHCPTLAQAAVSGMHRNRILLMHKIWRTAAEIFTTM
jgi:hypothetical protein